MGSPEGSCLHRAQVDTEHSPVELLLAPFRGLQHCMQPPQTCCRQTVWRWKPEIATEGIGELCLRKHLREFIFFSLQIFTCRHKEPRNREVWVLTAQGFPVTPSCETADARNMCSAKPELDGFRIFTETPKPDLLLGFVASLKEGRPLQLIASPVRHVRCRVCSSVAPARFKSSMPETDSARAHSLGRNTALPCPCLFFAFFCWSCASYALQHDSASLQDSPNPCIPQPSFCLRTHTALRCHGNPRCCSKSMYGNIEISEHDSASSQLLQNWGIPTYAASRLHLTIQECTQHSVHHHVLSNSFVRPRSFLRRHQDAKGSRNQPRHWISPNGRSEMRVVVLAGRLSRRQSMGRAYCANLRICSRASKFSAK